MNCSRRVGYGSQHLSLKYLGIPVESYRICEWAVKSIQAYKDLHFGDDNTDYSEGMSKDEVIDFLFNHEISADYNMPMSREQIARMGEAKCRTVYNNIKATHNLVSVCTTHASDLNIVDTDKYCYVMTYSFPCQDLSKAGLQHGMARGSGTRSGLLWEVERLLDECQELPQVLLMENVPDVIGSKNFKHFSIWTSVLEQFGYKNYYKVLNAKEVGYPEPIPQNRDRCFMVSILGDYFYEFPQPTELKTRLRDVIEKSVDEKYYITLAAAQRIQKSTFSQARDRIQTSDVCATILARDFKDPKCVQEAQIYPNSGNPQAGRIYSADGLSPTLDTCEGGNRMPKVIEPAVCDGFNQSVRKEQGTCGTITRNVGADLKRNGIGIIEPQKRIRKLTPRECFRLMGVKDEDFNKIAKNQSDSSLYHLAGDSIVTNVLQAIFKNMT